MSTKTQLNPFAATAATELPDDVKTRFQRGADGHTLADEKVIHVPIDEIAPDPQNVRPQDDPSMSAEALDSLALSIETAGQRVPIIVGPRNGQGKYQLIAGHRRFAAARRSKTIRTLKAILLRELPEGGERGILTIQLLENAHRPDVNPVSDAEAVKRLTDLCGDDRKKVQDILGLDRVSLHYKLQVAGAPIEIKDFARRTNVRDLQAICELVKLWNEDADKAKDLIGAKGEGSEAQGLRREVKEVRAAMRDAPKSEKETTKTTDASASTGTRGRAPAVTKIELDRSKQNPILYIEAKGHLHRFALRDEDIDTLLNTLKA